MNEHLRKNLARASNRQSLYGGPGSFSSTALAPEKETSDIIELAKKDLEKLKKREKKKKKRYCSRCVVTVWLMDVQLHSFNIEICLTTEMCITEYFVKSVAPCCNRCNNIFL